LTSAAALPTRTTVVAQPGAARAVSFATVFTLSNARVADAAPAGRAAIVLAARFARPSATGTKRATQTDQVVSAAAFLGTADLSRAATCSTEVATAAQTVVAGEAIARAAGLPRCTTVELGRIGYDVRIGWIDARVRALAGSAVGAVYDHVVTSASVTDDIVRGLVCHVVRGFVCHVVRGLVCHVVRGFVRHVVRGFVCHVVRGFVCHVVRGFVRHVVRGFVRVVRGFVHGARGFVLDVVRGGIVC
jgi:hypothetical protein